MTNPARALRRVGLSLAFYSLTGCGGELIHLGDGAPGSVGASGRSGGTGLGGASGTGVTGLGGAATGGMSNGGLGDTGGVAGARDCPHAEVAGSEVAWIGDSWLLVPQSQLVSDVQARAQASGATREDYVNLAMAASSMASIAQQYTMRESGSTKVKVLIMDGGTWDTIAAQMRGASVQSAAATAVADFQQFLAKVASDGTVESIVYLLVPPLDGIPGVDGLREPLRTACSASAVPCYFIDLKDAWNGRSDLDTGGSIPVPTSAGATVMADAIWSVMQDDCVAQ